MKRKYITYVLITCLIIIMPFIFKNNVLISDTKVGDNVPFLMESGMVIRKKIKIENTDTDSLFLKLGTYGKNNADGNMNIRIWDKDNNELFSKNIKFNRVVDNALLKIDLDKKLEKNNDYTIELFMQKIVPGNEIALWGHYTESEKITINDEEKNFDFNLYYNYDKPAYKLLIYLPLYFLLILLIELFDREEGEINVKKVKSNRKSK